MSAVITILDNGKLLKPQTIDDDNILKPFFETKETDEKGRCKLEETPEDWSYEMSGFETKEEYKKAIKRP